MGIGHTCGCLNIEGVQHTLLPSRVTADAYVLIRVHLFSCSVWFELLFDEHFHSLLICGFPIARKHRGVAGQATGDP